MSDTNWDQKKEIFAAALAVSPADRDEFLKRECAGDATLYRELEKLLAAHLTNEEFIEKPVVKIAAAFETKGANQIGKHFGHYRIIREIGRGGMGAVFLAERSDGEFKKNVALKIIRQTIVDAETEKLFRRERDILASLNHPNIAQLHDGGVSETGEAFLAMEYVEGATLLEYADRQNLSIEEKLRLFLKICAAVAYAHRNLVIHRDLKPANILVTKDGEPKLLDFGLAKILDENAADQNQTVTACRAFTPAYASPEQITGRKVTTVSDVYSLGVVFYELLAGEKPFHFEGKSIEEIIRTINDSEPPPPSFVVDEKKKRRGAKESVSSDGISSSPFLLLFSFRLKGDLDNIALKALQKKPERRYQSVEELGNDIERHLNGLPILARPATFSYRAAKFFRRNKIAAAAAAIVITSILTGAIFSFWQANEARKERDRAEKRFNDVRHLANSLLFEITPKIERLQGSTEAREILVKRALEYLDDLAGESRTDAGLQSELASAYEKIGDLQGNSNKPSLNDYAGAIESYRKAQNMRFNLSPTTENRRLLAENYRRYAAAVFTQNDVTGSLDATRESLKIYEQLLAENPNSFELESAGIETNLQYGTTFSINNKFSEAIPIFEKSIGDLSHLDQTNAETKRLKALTLAQLGNALSWNDKQPEAEAKMTEAVKMIDELAAQNPNDSVIRRDAFKIYSLASSIYEDTKDDVSLEFARKLLQTAIRAVEADSADSQAKSNLVRAYSRVGISFIKIRRISEGIFNLSKAQNELLQLAAQEPKNLAYQRELALIYVRFGDARTLDKNYAAAIEEYQKSVGIFESIGAQDDKNKIAPRDSAQSLKSIGETRLKLNEPAEAKIAYQKASAILQNLINQNALGEIDRKMFNDVQTALQKL